MAEFNLASLFVAFVHRVIDNPAKPGESALLDEVELFANLHTGVGRKRRKIARTPHTKNTASSSLSSSRVYARFPSALHRYCWRSDRPLRHPGRRCIRDRAGLLSRCPAVHPVAVREPPVFAGIAYTRTRSSFHHTQEILKASEPRKVNRSHPRFQSNRKSGLSEQYFCIASS